MSKRASQAAAIVGRPDDRQPITCLIDLESCDSLDRARARCVCLPKLTFIFYQQLTERNLQKRFAILGGPCACLASALLIPAATQNLVKKKSEPAEKAIIPGLCERPGELTTARNDQACGRLLENCAFFFFDIG